MTQTPNDTNPAHPGGTATASQFAMQASYHVAFQDFTLETSVEGITLTSHRKNTQIAWESILSAGPLFPVNPIAQQIIAERFAKELPAAAPAGAPKFVTEMEHLVRDFEQIWISYNDNRGRQQLSNIPVPLGAVGDQFVSELQSHIGDRWTTDPTKRPQRPKSRHPLLRALFIIPVLLVVLLLALVALLLFASGIAVVKILVMKYWYIAIFAIGFYYGIQKIRGKV